MTGGIGTLPGSGAVGARSGAVGVAGLHVRVVVQVAVGLVFLEVDFGVSVFVQNPHGEEVLG